MSEERKESLWRFFVATSLGVAIAWLSYLWGYGRLPPGVWEDVAIAAGLRPPAATFPLVWHMIVGQLFRFVEPSQAVNVLLIGGHCALGVATFLFYMILAGTLPSVLVAVSRVWWGRLLAQLVLILGTVMFACADPVWEAGQAFGPDIFLLIVILFVARLFVSSTVRATRIGMMCLNALLMGMLCAETTFGFVLVLASLVVCYVKSRSNPDTIENPLGDPFVCASVMRRMTALAMLGWIAMVSANVMYFDYIGGSAMNGWSGLEFVVRYLYHYVETVRAAATPSGWLLLVAVVVVPLIFAVAYLGMALNDDKFLSPWQALLYVAIGVMAFLQVAGWRSFWFWTWTGGSAPSVGSGLLRCISSVISAQTATFALCVLAVEIYIRNHTRIASTRFQDSVDDSRLGSEIADSFRQISLVGKFVMLSVPPVLLYLLLAWRMQPQTVEVVRLLNESAWLAAEECQGVQYLFTDGSSDAAVEISALQQGKRLYAVSMMAGNSPRERFLRTRGTEDPEDKEMLNRNSVDTLRTWMRLKPVRLADFAFQLGFELWGRGIIPAFFGGLTARLTEFPAGLAESGNQAVHALMGRVLKLYEKDEKLESISPVLRDKLMYLQWRLARLCRSRADSLEAQGKTEQSLSESLLADELDAHNVVFQQMRQQMEGARPESISLTPREGLKLGLERLNFKMAETFAQRVLASDPYDAPANFVVGMNYFAKGQYGRAEIYFKKCLERRPNDPAVLNNLAVAQLRQKKFDEAEANVRKALEVYPEAQEAKRTLESIKKAKKEGEAGMSGRKGGGGDGHET